MSTAQVTWGPTSLAECANCGKPWKDHFLPTMSCAFNGSAVFTLRPLQVHVLFEEISDQHGTSKPIGVFLHDLTEAEQRAQSPTKRTYVKKFEVHP